MILVSSCLIGLKCRYDASIKENTDVIKYLSDKEYWPICPEQMGGLATPRKPAEIVSNNPLKIVDNQGYDVTENFLEGANQVIEIIKDKKVSLAILKAKSPSCGSENIYDGTFSNKLVEGQGILTKLLREKGIRVINEKKAEEQNE